MRRAFSMLLLSALPAAAGEVPLRDFFNPAARAFRLPALTKAEFDQLGVKQRLWARGLDPVEYFTPPRYEDAIPQAMNRRARLAPGFGHRERFVEKKRFWRMASREASIRDQLELLELLPLPEPKEFARRYWHLTEGMDPAFDRNQAVHALRQSERRFRRWWVDELGREIDSARSSQQRFAIRFLARGLRHKAHDVRVGSARALGWLAVDEARKATEKAMRTARDPDLRSALVAARARQGGETRPRLLRSWLNGSDDAMARAAVRAIELIDEPWTFDALHDRIESARGRLREECIAAIARRNGAEPDNEGHIDFYGIRSRSRRVLFCIDVSYSMRFPMDGMGGKREPRRRRTLRELTRTLESIPEGVEFNVLNFSSTQTPLWRKLRPADAETRKKALEFARTAPLEPGTNIYRAFEFALRSGADTVFFLTDGEPSTGLLIDSAQLIDEIRARNEFGTLRIHCIGLSRDQNSELLYNLARSSGGRFTADR
jgi:hypothetical protein